MANSNNNNINNNNREREYTPNSIDIISEVIETKLDQLIQSVKEIKETMHDNSIDIANLKLELTNLSIDFLPNPSSLYIVSLCSDKW